MGASVSEPYLEHLNTNDRNGGKADAGVKSGPYGRAFTASCRKRKREQRVDEQRDHEQCQDEASHQKDVRYRRIGFDLGFGAFKVVGENCIPGQGWKGSSRSSFDRCQ